MGEKELSGGAKENRDEGGVGEVDRDGDILLERIEYLRATPDDCAEGSEQSGNKEFGWMPSLSWSRVSRGWDIRKSTVMYITNGENTSP